MLHPHLEKRRSDREGYGLFATRLIKAGEVVWKLDPKDRWLTLTEVRSGPPEYRRYAFQHRNRYILTQDGSQYMNHSCDPNTWYMGDDSMVARRDIQAGEEVTFDYTTSEVEPPYRFSWRCRCGASDCRKHVSNQDCLDPKFQEKYKGHLPSWILEYIEHRKAIARPECISFQIACRRFVVSLLMMVARLGMKGSRLFVAFAAGLCDLEDLTRYTNEEREREEILNLTNEPYVLSGIQKWEEPMLQFLKPRATIGIVGCEAGRLAVALEKMGYSVDGVDSLPRLIDAAKTYLLKTHSKSRVFCADIFHFEFPAKLYHAFIFSWNAYGTIPSRERRVSVLKRLRGRLENEGRVILALTPYSTWGRQMTRLAHWVGQFMRNPNPPSSGDFFSLHLGYEHSFMREEIEEEARAAGFVLDPYLDNGLQILAILKKQAT